MVWLRLLWGYHKGYIQQAMWGWMGLEDLVPKWLTLIDVHLWAVPHPVDSPQGCLSSCYGDCWHGFLELENKWSERVRCEQKRSIKSFGSCHQSLSMVWSVMQDHVHLEKEFYKLWIPLGHAYWGPFWRWMLRVLNIIKSCQKYLFSDRHSYSQCLPAAFLYASFMGGARHVRVTKKDTSVCCRVCTPLGVKDRPWQKYFLPG